MAPNAVLDTAPVREMTNGLNPTRAARIHAPDTQLEDAIFFEKLKSATLFPFISGHSVLSDHLLKTL